MPGPSQFRGLRQDLFHHFTVHVRQAIVPALETIRELRVIKAQQMHDRCLQIVNVNFVFRDRKTKLVRFAV